MITERLDKEIHKYSDILLKESLSVGQTLEKLELLKTLLFIKFGNFAAYNEIKYKVVDKLLGEGKLNDKI